MKFSFHFLRNTAPVVFALSHGVFSAGAQTPFPPPLPADGQKMMFFTTARSVDEKAVTGAPYSATSTTTMTQTLSNGTRIVQTQQTNLARDSAGRTRREESLQSIGPWSTAQTPQTVVFINDPVAHCQYVLEQDSQTAVRVSTPAGSLMTQKVIAEKMAKDMVYVNSGASISSDAGTPDDQKLAAEKMAKDVMVVTSTAGPASSVTLSSSGPLRPPMADGNVFVHRMIGDDKDATTEKLPDQVIEGLTVHGTRTTSTIPVGAMGNDQPIVTTYETWYSPDLQMVVLAKRSDPRVGDTVTALTGVSRGEPAASLFQVPAGYAVKESDQPTEIHFKTQQH
jgi:hypothetical protein